MPLRSSAEAGPRPTGSCAIRWRRCAAGSWSSASSPGERVATLIGNNWYFVVSYLAALGAGLVVVPLNPQSPAKALEREIADDRSGRA